MSAAKERPILFSGPMVRAILDGRKTQTRRVLSPGNIHGDISSEQAEDFELRGWETFWHRDVLCAANPRYAVGDRLWVRERGAISASKTAFIPYVGNEPALDAGRDSPIWPRSPDGRPYKACVSIHMPRWASRITLEVTGVKVERLQDISPDDAWEEGVRCDMSSRTFIDHFRNLWNRVNGEGAWEANPWVVAISFARVP